MKKLLLLPVLLSMVASAEIYEDFTPSQEPMELTVVAVQPNYVDTYLTNLNRTWVRAMNVQKKLGYVEDFNVWTSLSVADTPNVWITVQYKDLASMQQTEEKNKAVEAELEKTMIKMAKFRDGSFVPEKLLQSQVSLHQSAISSTSEVG